MNVQTNNNRATDKAFNAAVQTIADEGKGSSQVPAVVARVDLLSTPVLFLVNSHNRTTDTISYFSGKDGKINEAPLEYYRSTKPAEKAEVQNKLVKDYMAAAGVKEVIVRKRLVKENSIQRDQDGKVESKDIEAWKAKLIKALTEVINDM